MNKDWCAGDGGPTRCADDQTDRDGHQVKNAACGHLPPQKLLQLDICRLKNCCNWTWVTQQTFFLLLCFFFTAPSFVFQHNKWQTEMFHKQNIPPLSSIKIQNTSSSLFEVARVAKGIFLWMFFFSLLVVGDVPTIFIHLPSLTHGYRKLKHLNVSQKCLLLKFYGKSRPISFGWYYTRKC